MALELYLGCNTLEIPEQDFLWPPGLFVTVDNLSEITRERLGSIPGLQISVMSHLHRSWVEIRQDLSKSQMSRLLQI